MFFMLCITSALTTECGMGTVSVKGGSKKCSNTTSCCYIEWLKLEVMHKGKLLHQKTNQCIVCIFDDGYLNHSILIVCFWYELCTMQSSDEELIDFSIVFTP